MNLHWHHYHSETHFTLGITLGILHFMSFDRCPKNWCLQTVVLEKTPESPLDSKEIKPINLKGNQPWILIGRTDAEVETSVLWSSEANSWLIGKVPDAGKDWGQKEKRASEDEMADGITDTMDMNVGKLREMVRDREAWRAIVRGATKSWTRLGGWTTTTTIESFTALKILCAPPIHSSFSTNTWQLPIFYCLHSSAFFRMSYSWNHTMCGKLL